MLLSMISLYRFDVKENGIDFVLHQIAADILLQYDDMLLPLVESLAETLQLYRSFSQHPTILTDKMLDNNRLGVMLSKGLGEYITLHIKRITLFLKMDNGLPIS